ncbi:uncharacterized protein BYT42DRAFT_615490 [Radiomyces spectabilis]|uniref:uncharacterized protein n=1 Tax=Radiomyces spectabilis TaxID=64574 RepID=UPI00221ECE57|nr:uncharacterized protein BYT42DRAFT_615490 [Radiomyces spectabilis]KAI8374316.1 hypothetical protein BYT42DRAFT_615490 [Radiomyces spectabilis]
MSIRQSKNGLDTSLPFPAIMRGYSDRALTPIVIYLVVSLFATIVEKFLATGSEYKFPFPLFTAFFQLLITAVLMRAWEVLGKMTSFRVRATGWDRATATRIVPLSCVYVCLIVVDIHFLQTVPPTLYLIVRAISIPISILLSLRWLHQTVSSFMQGMCIAIIIGLWLASDGLLALSTRGIFWGLIYATLIAVYSVLIKNSLVVVHQDIWRLLYYYISMAIPMMGVILWISGESSRIRKEVYFLDEFGFWFQMVIAAIIGFVVNATMIRLVKLTSPLIHCISMTTKGCLQVFTIAILMDNPLHFQHTVGILMALISCFICSFA